MADWITIDGAAGEGGGQILRTALALSLVTGQRFRMERIRAGRAKPGLLRQHLTAVQTSAAISGAEVTGADVGARELTFAPSRVKGGDYQAAIGTAGSATLVLQAVLPALLVADAPTRLTIEGGTHNPFAPPFDFLARTFLPLVQRMGARVQVQLDRYGFYPAGGGRFTATIDPCRHLAPLALDTRGDTRVSARAMVASLPQSIAWRELTVVQQRLGIGREACQSELVESSVGPGNVLMIVMESHDVVEVVTGFGEKGVSAEQVAHAACDAARSYLDADVPVGMYLADQLLIPLALAGEGTFRTMRPSTHTTTNVEVIRKFLDVDIRIAPDGDAAYRITVQTRKV